MNNAGESAAPRHTLLLVDDSPVNLELVVESLELEGHEVLVALDGMEALERAARVVPDLILLDVMMPGIDGFEVCRRLKADPVTGEIPVIFMTSLSAMQNEVEGFAAGGVDYLTKPLHVDEVRARVNAHLRLRTLHRQLEEKNRALLRSEEEYRTLTENSDDVIVRYDRDCRRLYLNPAWERINGVARDAVLGKAPGERAGRIAATSAPFEAMLRRVIADGRGEEYELSWHDEEGEPVYFDLRAIPEFGADGMVTSVLTVARDVTAHRRAEAALRRNHQRLEETEEQLRQLATRREELREAERKRIAWQMHEELGQYLTTIRLGLGTLRASFADHAPGLDGEARALTQLLDHTLRIVREVAAELRPPVLDHGLPHALEWLADDFCRRTGLPCRWQQEGAARPLDEGRTLTLFRFAEEALENVARHAAANRADLLIEWNDDHCRLTVRDDGRGFDLRSTARKPLGLMAIEARLAVFDGILSNASLPGGGTTITARLPLAAAAPGA
ncbi:hybrid sensor histidine kinase/response regulator [Endothiovibrio diazotrophicus]